VGPEVATKKYNIDVKLGAIKEYANTLSQEFSGTNGAHRMKEALRIYQFGFQVPTESGGVRFTNRLPTSNPVPTLELDSINSSSVQISAGMATVTVTGSILDFLADNAPRLGVSEGGADIEYVNIAVDGKTVKTVAVTSSTDGEPNFWRQHPWKGSFSTSITFPISGAHQIQVTTGLNAVNKVNSDSAIIKFKKKPSGISGIDYVTSEYRLAFNPSNAGLPREVDFYQASLDPIALTETVIVS
jgi:hypothetical protein